MSHVRPLVLALIVPTCLFMSPKAAGEHKEHNRNSLKKISSRLQGQILDYTHNHGCDRRMWSESMCQKRDLYVYLPPGFRPDRQYPVLIWLHGFAQDENYFLEGVVERLDQAIVAGRLAPVIVAAPDGSISGEPTLMRAGSFFINSKAGRYEDYLMGEVWPFLQRQFPIRPEPEAHVLAGVSMGGGAAFNLAIKHSEQFKVAAAFFPPLNLRWLDCHGRYRSNFDPCCWGWRTNFDRGREVIARFYGIVTIRVNDIFNPLFDNTPAALQRISEENPIENLDRYEIQRGQLDLFVAYGGRDQFNMDAQVESFLFRARQRGIDVGVGYLPEGKHDTATAYRLLPAAIEWLGQRLERFGPVP